VADPRIKLVLGQSALLERGLEYTDAGSSVAGIGWLLLITPGVPPE